MKLDAAGGTIEGIQWLRAIAALMVVMHHARHSVPGSEGWPQFGAAGVDVFFVISGFVMAHTTRRLGDGAEFGQRLHAAGGFLRKRFARLVPLYWIALLWTARRELLQGDAGVGLVRDALFLPRPNPTYPDQLWPAMIQGWTLNYEMVFYALFALSLLCGRRRTAVLLGTLALAVALGPWLSPASGAIAPGDWAGAVRRFYTDNIVLEFGFGVLLQRAVSARPSPAWPRSVYLLLMGCGFVLLALGHDHAPRSLTEGLPALLIVWASLSACRGLRSRALELLADASYAIYLFHWASFGLVKPVAAALPGLRAFADSPAPVQAAILVLLHIGAATLAGVMLHLLVERPLVRLVQRALPGAAAPRRPAAIAV